jgi:ribonuclease R
MNRAGKGFLQPDNPELPEIAIPEGATATALHEDRVLVRRDAPTRGPGPGPATGRVIRVLERRRTRIVGSLARNRDGFHVIPDDPRIPHDIQVPAPRDLGRAAYPGDKVVVEIGEWLSRQTQPEGEIVELLGAPDEEGVDMLSVLRQYDLPLHFPRPVLHEARAYGTTVTADDLKGRIDCRGHRVVTIDPDDAKDFDDAIHLERAGADQWRLWVHIADVSHYVKPGTALDAEARRRGNSTYLVDRVIPMLPEALSNELCSLKPDVERLTKCVEFLLSNDGRVLGTKLYSAVIRSQRRFTYGEALAILQRPPTNAIEGMLHDAHELAQRIRRTRFERGSLELDFPETKIRLDERGRVLRIDKIENDVSHQLIEEFMLLANEAVAGRLTKARRPAVYRVHEDPQPARLQEYRELVLGHNVPCGNLLQRREIQRLLRTLSDHPVGPALRIGFLKSLNRARYDIEPKGHYGLAKQDYTHFTSPIRRYADLLVHRAAFHAVPLAPAELREAAEHISLTERNSADAERDSKDVKMFAHLQKQLDGERLESYPALVTDVRNFGFFVDVPGLAMSGLVPVSALEDDYYVFDAERNQLLGRRTRRLFRLGDKVTVQVSRIERFKKQVDFRLVREARPQRGTPTRGAAAQGQGPRTGTAGRSNPAPRRAAAVAVARPASTTRPDPRRLRAPAAPTPRAASQSYRPFRLQGRSSNRRQR